MLIKLKQPLVVNSLIMALLITLFAYTGLLCYIADSEIWAISSARYFLQKPYEFGFLAKPLFYALLYFSQTTITPWDPLTTCRIVFIINGICLIGLTFLTAKTLTKSLLTAFLAAFLLLCSTFFMTRGFRVRADLLATTLIMLHLYLFWKLSAAPRNYKLKAITLSILTLLPIAATPNGALFMLCYSPLFLATLRNNKLFANYFWRAQITVVLVAFSLIIILIPVTALSSALVNTSNFFLNTFLESGFGVSFFAGLRFIYVYRFFIHNPHFIIPIIASVVVLYLTIKGNMTNHHNLWPLALAIVLICILVTLYPAKLPYFITALLPLPAIGTAIIFVNIYERFRKRQSKLANIFLVYIIISCFFMACLKSYTILTTNNNLKQMSTITTLTSYMAQFPTVRIFDSLGLIFSHELTNLFVGPGEYTKKGELVDQLIKEKIDIVLYTRKIFSLEPNISQALYRYYLETPNGIYFRALSLPLINHFIAAASGQPNWPTIIKQLANEFGLLMNNSSNILFKIYTFQMKFIHPDSYVNDKSLITGRDLVSVPIELNKLQSITLPQEAFFIQVSIFPYIQLEDNMKLQDLFRYDNNI